MAGGAIRFGDLEVDLEQRRLRVGGEERHLAPLEWSLLAQLLRRPGEVVTKQELLDRVWPAQATTEYALSRSVRRLRETLGDDARSPRYVRTEHGVGFRWIADLEDVTTHQGDFTGRAKELVALADAAAAAAAGRRTFVAVEGELGAGKTTLVAQALAGLDARWRIGRGRCVEAFHTPEPLGPLLDAIDALASSGERSSTVDLLRRFAPTWLAQMPWLAAPDDLDLLDEAMRLATGPRMLREFTRLVEHLGELAPIVIWLDDVHWADPATLDALDTLAERDGPARLLVVTCHRGTDALASGHPISSLVTRLEHRGALTRVPLAPLAEDELAALTARRLGLDSDESARIAGRLWAWTGGNPLFAVSMLDHLSTEAAAGIDDLDVPPTMQALIAERVAALSPDALDALEVAALVGERFDVDVVAGALDRDAEAVELALDSIASTSIVTRGAAGDGGSHRFRHAAYRSGLADRVGPIRAKRLHLAIGDALVTRAGPDADARALAHHFEAAGSSRRAIPYLLRAAHVSQRRFAHADALVLFGRALDAMGGAPSDSATSAEPIDPMLEIEARLGLALCQLYLRSSEDDTTRGNIDRLQTLVEPLADDATMFAVWQRTLLVNNLAGRTDRVRAMAPTLLRMATERGRVHERMDAHHAMGEAALHANDLDGAIEHFDRADELFGAGFIDVDPNHRSRLLWLRDSGARIKSARAGVYHLRGERDRVRPEIVAALALSDDDGLNTPIVKVANATICGSILFLMGDTDGAARFAERALAVADAENEDFAAIADVLRWATGTPAEPAAVRAAARTLVERPAIPFPLGPLVFSSTDLLPDDEMVTFLDRIIDRCARVDTHWCDDAFRAARQRLAR